MAFFGKVEPENDIAVIRAFIGIKTDIECYDGRAGGELNDFVRVFG